MSTTIGSCRTLIAHTRMKDVLQERLMCCARLVAACTGYDAAMSAPALLIHIQAVLLGLARCRREVSLCMAMQF